MTVSPLSVGLLPSLAHQSFPLDSTFQNPSADAFRMPYPLKQARTVPFTPTRPLTLSWRTGVRPSHSRATVMSRRSYVKSTSWNASAAIAWSRLPALVPSSSRPTPPRPPRPPPLRTKKTTTRPPPAPPPKPDRRTARHRSETGSA